MGVKFYGGSMTDCGAGVIAHTSADIEFHDGFKMSNCGVGVGIYATQEELSSLLQISRKHMQEIEQITHKLQQTKPSLRKKVLTTSAVFAALSASSNSATVMQFLIDNFPLIAELLARP